MDTQTLIQRLSGDLDTARRHHRPSPGLQLGLVTLASAALVVSTVFAGLEVRADLSQTLGSARGLAKFAAMGFAVALAWVALARSLEPGRPVLSRELGVAIVLLLAWCIGWISTSPAGAGTIWGTGNPLGCVLSILGLALAPLGAVLAILRSGAPTRPGLTGAVAGILAGAVAAFGFGFACPADMNPYVATWYPAAIALVAALGAGIGRHILAW